VPRPSYPLFEHLTALESVQAVPYDLDAHADWRMDVAAITRAIDERTRAVLVVSPNNPTGSVLERADLEALADVAAARGVAIVGDEVFADFEFGNHQRAVSVLAQDRALAFGLGGLSKSVGLPQVKVAWIGASGPRAQVDEALRGLEVIADTFLSVSTPAQVALPTLLADGVAVRNAIRERCARNLSALAHAAAEAPAVSLLRPVGGWTAVLQVPAARSEDALVLSLVDHDGVIAHPGYFFDFPREAFLVLSLLVAPEMFDVGVARLLARATETA
jgi:aspartate/methionine/tyrosine aminotransferase